jgi:papilin
VDAGTCNKYKIYWAFNKVDRQCVQFYYGGCDGNQNRFENREYCEISCLVSGEEKNKLIKLPEDCIAPLDYGDGDGDLSSSSCRKEDEKWYFNYQTNECYSFKYKNCGTVDLKKNVKNRFDSNDECQQKCMRNETNFNVSLIAENTQNQDVIPLQSNLHI